MTGRQIFEDIRDIPYRVAEFMGDDASNCAVKGKLLLERLGFHGYTVRGRIAAMDWRDTLVPKEIAALHPIDIPATHFYIELYENNVWRALDPSWDSGLARAGFPLATFDGENSPGLLVRRVFDADEQRAYLALCAQPGYAEAYFTQATEFLKQVNLWLATIRAA